MTHPDSTLNCTKLADAHRTASVLVPIVRATSETVAGYGTLVSDFQAEDIIRVTWPKTTGWRPIVPGTGNLQPPVEGDFRVRWFGDVLYGDNLTVGVSFKLGQPVGRLSSDESRNCVLIREVNYHPDGGQVFFPPPEGRPYVMLLAPADVGDDVRPEHFKAFYFDGNIGFHIAPGTWHYAPYILPPSSTSDKAEMTFRNKQSSVFACVAADTVKEFGVYLKVPLSLDPEVVQMSQ